MTILSVVSDLHLEWADCALPGGDILAIAGDTLPWDVFRPERTDKDALRCRPVFRRFLWEELRKYAEVLLVLGNHDFWGGYLRCLPEFASSVLAKYAPHARLLHNSWCEIDGVRFIGTPLWATYGYGTANHYLLQKGMKDFVRINKHGAQLLVGDLNTEHKKCVAFLAQALRTDLPCVVITHHAPTYHAIDRKHFPDGNWDDAYASNQHALLMSEPQPRLWLHGHVHYRYRKLIGEAKVTANPRGYYGEERMSLGFNPCEADVDLKTMEFIE